MTIAFFVVLLLAGTAAVIAPLARRPLAWPADPPDQRDDVARAVSSLRDLEFARAAGTIAPADYVRLRASLERDAFVRRPPESRGKAPVRTLVAAALIAAIATSTVRRPRARRFRVFFTDDSFRRCLPPIPAAVRDGPLPGGGSRSVWVRRAP